MSIHNSLAKACERVEQESREHRRSTLKSNRSRDEIDELILTHALPATEVDELLGMNHVSFKDFYLDAVKDGVIPEVLKVSNQYKYTLDHVHALMDHAGTPKYADKNLGTHILSVTNLKGGTGKSTTATNVAMGIALALKDRKRVAIIDLDPQGSQSQFTNIDIESDYNILTAVDIMLGSIEDDSEYTALIQEGYSHDDIVLDSMIDTHIPNLSVLPAHPDDERFNGSAWNQYINDKRDNADSKMTHLNLLSERVIKPLMKEYDVIIIDTAPQMNPLVWSALEAANVLLIPCTPHALDWTSTQSFLKSLLQTLDMLPSEGENLKWWKVLCTNFDDEHNRDQAILDRMKESLGSDLFSNAILRSQAFEKASQMYRTVYDIRKSDKLCSPRQLDKATMSLKSAHREISMFIADIDVRG